MPALLDTLAQGELFHTKKGRPVACPRALAPIADTHGHLTVFRQHDPALAIARAALAGVRLMAVPLDPTEDAKDPAASAEQMDAWVRTAREALAVAADAGVEPPAFPDVPPLVDNVWTLAGVHPYGAGDLLADPSRWDALLAFLEQPRCLGIGEIGLDYHCDVPREVQIEAFRRQLALAVERDLPVELHLRDADDDPAALAHADALAVMDETGLPAAGVDLHCFTSGPAVLRPFAERGCFIAFGGAMTFKNSEDIRDAMLSCPVGQLLSETDSPYLAPMPLRGQECEPAMVALTVAAMEELRADAGLDEPRATAAALWANANRFLGR